MTKTFKTVYLSLLVAQSLALFLFEGLIPLPFLAPGAKLGLANLITLIALYTLPRWQDTLLVILVRIILATMFGGGPTILLYSLSGGLLSFVVMLLLRRYRCFSLLGISAAGGFAHNLGQLLVASLVIGNPGLLLYLPILGPCGLLTGLLLGSCSQLMLKKLSTKRFPSF
ncbi:MAG: Gx transporter family protein [Selenomonas sp.]|nr:Gx transporter family protein [Selenomonas sp.]